MIFKNKKLNTWHYCYKFKTPSNAKLFLGRALTSDNKVFYPLLYRNDKETQTIDFNNYKEAKNCFIKTLIKLTT